MMREGTNEIMVGDGVVANYENIAVGKTVRWGNADWVIVGRFSDDGGIAESEAWADARLVQQVWKRGQSFQSVRARLTDESDATLKKLKDTLTKDPRVQVVIQREPAFYAEQQAMMSALIKGAGVFFAIMMGLAAIFAAVNTMFNAVASRVREIATLRAMGFGAAPVVFSVLVEALLLGAAGGLLGGVLALLFLNGMQSSTMNFQTFSQITLCVHGDAAAHGHGDHLRPGADVHRGPAARYSRRAHADHDGAARIVMRGFSLKWMRGAGTWIDNVLGLVVCVAQALMDWSDVEGRIQYAYYTNDARALNSMLTSLRPKAVEGEEAAGRG